MGARYGDDLRDTDEYRRFDRPARNEEFNVEYWAYGAGSKFCRNGFPSDAAENPRFAENTSPGDHAKTSMGSPAVAIGSARLRTWRTILIQSRQLTQRISSRQPSGYAGRSEVGRLSRANRMVGVRRRWN